MGGPTSRRGPPLGPDRVSPTWAAENPNAILPSLVTSAYARERENGPSSRVARAYSRARDGSSRDRGAREWAVLTREEDRDRECPSEDRTS